MVEVFKYVDKFFTSLTNYLTYNHIFIIFVGLFLLTILGVVFFTSRSYESRLIKAIDKLNNYFIDNPYINDDNLVSFNEKMKSNVVPKQLRKHWQQFVLYRENKASTYMSFENCVSNPLKTSTYTRDVKLMGVLAWIFSLCALVLNCYYCFETVDIAAALRGVLLTPIVILLLNYFAHIFLNLKHNAIVSDLFQNYQYFELNIDKATSTLPEYVDYEVLFDKNEIKKGIPILYAYLQKRAEEEQRELERARLKNVEHEKFNFDDQGIAGSLVLERAMQEVENYIAERKKYTQDIGQINADITQEDMNYREITKEYNRQMQVSKETFANFKSQLEEVSSTIEANYLKKQQQQELDRQRNLERDFDAATERHKKIIESYQAELDTVDKFIAQSRKTLEDAMKSEFETYNGKVYDEARKAVDQREKEKYQKLKQNINELEESLFSKTKELEKTYQTNQVLTDKLTDMGVVLEPEMYVEAQPKQEEKPEKIVETKYEEPVEEEKAEEPVSMSYEEYRKRIDAFKHNEEPVQEEQEETNEADLEETETYEDVNANEEFEEVEAEEDFDFEEDLETEEPVEEISTEQTDDSIQEEKPVARRGRPRKVVDTSEEKTEKKRPGRPRKVVDETEVKPKRSVGRPRKVVDPTAPVEPKKGRGRPRKTTEEKPVEKTSKGRGRPRKTTQEEPVVKITRGRGRPKKDSSNNVLNDIEDIDAYLKEIDDAIAQENAKLEESKKQLAKKSKIKNKK